MTGIRLLAHGGNRGQLKGLEISQCRVRRAFITSTSITFHHFICRRAHSALSLVHLTGGHQYEGASSQVRAFLSHLKTVFPDKLNLVSEAVKPLCGERCRKMKNKLVVKCKLRQNGTNLCSITSTKNLTGGCCCVDAGCLRRNFEH